MKLMRTFDIGIYCNKEGNLDILIESSKQNRSIDRGRTDARLQINFSAATRTITRQLNIKPRLRHWLSAKIPQGFRELLSRTRSVTPNISRTIQRHVTQASYAPTHAARGTRWKLGPDGRIPWQYARKFPRVHTSPLSLFCHAYASTHARARSRSSWNSPRSRAACAARACSFRTKRISVKCHVYYGGKTLIKPSDRTPKVTQRISISGTAALYFVRYGVAEFIQRCLVASPSRILAREIQSFAFNWPSDISFSSPLGR